MSAKYPRRTIALGPPYDDGSYFDDGVRRSLPVKGNADAITAVIKSIRHRLAIMAGPGVVGLPREKEWGTAFDEMCDDLQVVLDAIEESSVQPAGVLDEAWAAAEKALPEGEYLTGVQLVDISPDGPETWQAFCSMAAGTYESGPTPAAALHALAAALGRSGSGGGRG